MGKTPTTDGIHFFLDYIISTKTGCLLGNQGLIVEIIYLHGLTHFRQGVGRYSSEPPHILSSTSHIPPEYLVRTPYDADG